MYQSIKKIVFEIAVHPLLLTTLVLIVVYEHNSNSYLSKNALRFFESVCYKTCFVVREISNEET